MNLSMRNRCSPAHLSAPPGVSSPQKRERQCGSLIEAGAALSAGKRAFAVSAYNWSFAHHPRCRRFNALAEAAQAITATPAVNGAFTPMP